MHSWYIVFLTVLLIVAAYEFIVFVVYAARIADTGVDGDHALAIQRLQNLLRLPSLLGFGKDHVQLLIGDRLLFSRRYEEAIVVLKDLLMRAPSRDTGRARELLADALDAVGRHPQAESERQMVLRLATEEPSNAVLWMSQANIAARQQRYQDAYKLYERAYHDPFSRLGLRPQLVGKLALAAMNLGHPHDTIRWAEMGLKLGSGGALKGVYHRQAGTSYSNIGDLDAAAKHFNEAYAVAQGSNDSSAAAQSLAGLSGVQRNMGQFDAAIENGRKALNLSSFARVANIYLFETYMTLGRYDEARDTILYSGESSTLTIPSNEKRSAAAMHLALGRIHAETGHFDAALAELSLASPVFTELKMAAYCKCMAAWFQAGAGAKETALTSMQEGAQMAERLSDSPGSQRDDYSMLARAALLLGEYDSALGYAGRLFARHPHPADLPQAHYLVGEARRGLGDADAARAAYQAGWATGIRSVWMERIRERFGEI